MLSRVTDKCVTLTSVVSVSGGCFVANFVMGTDEKTTSTAPNTRTTNNEDKMNVKVNIEDQPSTCFGRVRSSFYELLLPKFNKHSSYIFGSEIAFKSECDRQRQSGVWVIHPLSSVR